MPVDFKSTCVRGHSFNEELESKGIDLESIPTSDQVTGIEIRLSKAHIINNNTPKIPPFPGYARLYFVIVVVSDIDATQPMIKIEGMPKVGDDEDLPVNRTIFYWKETEESPKAPSHIHSFVSIIKSKENLRNFGKTLETAQDDSRYGEVISTLATVANIANPVNIPNIILDAAGILGGLLGKVEDKPLFSWVQSYSDINGDFDNMGKTPFSFKNRHAEVEISFVLRDTSRELEAAANNNIPLEDLGLD